MRGYHIVASICVAIVASATMQACTDGNAGDAVHSKATAAAGPQQIRGTIQSVGDTGLVVMTVNGPVRLALADTTGVAAVIASDRQHITNGSFLGIGSATQPDGSQRAVEITVFPEALRGTGEGSYPWNHPDGSSDRKMTNGTAGSLKMTNGSVAASRMTNGSVAPSRMTNGAVASHGGSSSIPLTYNADGSQSSQTITIPPDVPIVTLEAAHVGDLQAGAHVIVFAVRDSTGALSAARVLFGKNGLVPPQ